MKFSDEDLRDQDMLEFLREQECTDIGWGSDFEDDFARIMSEGQNLSGSRLPWDEYDQCVAFAPGEISVHGGMNRHRKSMVLGQLAGWFALQGDRVGIMSFEMPIAQSMRRMCLQMAGTSNPTERWYRSWARWNNSRVCYYDKFDTTPAQRVIAAAQHMAATLGCKHIVIDSLTKCGLPYGDGAAAKDFIDVLTDTARACNTHIHLVAHVRKPESRGGNADDHRPNRYDIRGAGEISDLAHNVILHWANLRKKRIQDKADLKGIDPMAMGLDDKDLERLEQPCQLMIVDKQRSSPWDGDIALWQDRASLQFHRGRVLKPDIFSNMTENMAAA